MKPRVRIRAGSRIGVVVPARWPTGPRVEETLASVVASVQGGGVDSIAVAVTYVDGSTGTGFALNGRRLLMVGALEVMLARMKDKIKVEGG